MVSFLVLPGWSLAHAASGPDGLDPTLSRAYDQAAAAAGAQGIPLWITSGARSVAEQEGMWRDGIATHGSPDAARRWVLPPAESTHVGGHAIDVGPQAGAAWLEANGSRWGLCRTFANEWWHFEVTTPPGTPCPPMWADASVRGKPSPDARGADQSPAIAAIMRW
ncbi:M15 family metallopeptidase [Aldersonia kunmingensis]|uniref:M15 family metallopeptidase n=1 Tax=Aldersonia kunmingensis TaxID=408066 RepID=UPI001FE1204B|nr:M15 family metallopeptidase [Aldersonia kunmingensis]